MCLSTQSIDHTDNGAAKISLSIKCMSSNGRIFLTTESDKCMLLLIRLYDIYM